jgi:hypothetical protein
MTTLYKAFKRILQLQLLWVAMMDKGQLYQFGSESKTLVSFLHHRRQSVPWTPAAEAPITTAAAKATLSLLLVNRDENHQMFEYLFIWRTKGKPSRFKAHPPNPMYLFINFPTRLLWPFQAKLTNVLNRDRLY